jgi:hypothetical protein
MGPPTQQPKPHPLTGDGVDASFSIWAEREQQSDKQATRVASFVSLNCEARR